MMTENMVCANNAGQDGCQGDSGGKMDLNLQRIILA